MALLGQDRPLFGPREGATPAALMAESTGATTSSPFLQYLASNAPAAQQTSQALMGEAPRADYGNALLQTGLSMMSQPGDRTFLQALGTAGQTAMPLVQAEKQKIEQHERQVKHMAAKLGMSAAEFDMKLGGKRKGIKCFDGVCIDEDSYASALQQNGGDMESAFENAVVHRDRPVAQDNARHLAQLRRNLEINKNRPNANPEEIQLAQDELEAMEAQIFPAESTKEVTFGWMDESGTYRMASGSPGAVANGIAQINNADEVKKLKTQQEATDQVLYYASNIKDVFDKASIYSGGTLGSMASKASAWGRALTDSMDGPRNKQFQEDVGRDPNDYVAKLRADPETRNLLGEDFLDSLSSVGQDNAAALSNIIGLAYATARAEEPGGRLSNQDVAAQMSALGFDPEAMLNDPARVLTGVQELARRNVASYERSIELSDMPAEQKESILSNDVVLNKRLDEYGFNWSGGPRGQLTFKSDQPSGTQAPQPAPVVPPQSPVSTPQPQGQPVQVQSKEQMDQLPSGTHFVAPDGSVRVKP